LVDEVALLRALESGQLGGAALDVRIHEPTPVDDPIANHPNVLVTPHVAGKTEESSRRMAEMAVMNLLAVKRGDWSIEGLVNPEIVAQPTQTPPR
jgi:D-3-phosphoglycerate dehydrogenase